MELFNPFVSTLAYNWLLDWSRGPENATPWCQGRPGRRRPRPHIPAHPPPASRRELRGCERALKLPIRPGDARLRVSKGTARPCSAAQELPFSTTGRASKLKQLTMRTHRQPSDPASTIDLEYLHLVGLDKRSAIVMRIKVSRHQLIRRLVDLPALSWRPAGRRWLASHRAPNPATRARRPPDPRAPRQAFPQGTLGCRGGVDATSLPSRGPSGALFLAPPRALLLRSPARGDHQ